MGDLILNIIEPIFGPLKIGLEVGCTVDQLNSVGCCILEDLVSAEFLWM
jgi:hypothetical protein